MNKLTLCWSCGSTKKPCKAEFDNPAETRAGVCKWVQIWFITWKKHDNVSGYWSVLAAQQLGSATLDKWKRILQTVGEKSREEDSSEAVYPVETCLYSCKPSRHRRRGGILSNFQSFGGTDPHGYRTSATRESESKIVVGKALRRAWWNYGEW